MIVVEDAMLLTIGILCVHICVGLSSLFAAARKH